MTGPTSPFQGVVASRFHGARGKTRLTPTACWAIGVPRDRNASFESPAIPKYEPRFTTFDGKNDRYARRAATQSHPSKGRPLT